MAHEPASAARDGPAEPLEAFGGLDGRSPPTVVVPERFQMSRRKGWRKAPNTVYLGQPGKFGNPLSVEEHGRAAAIALYQAWILEPPKRRYWRKLWRHCAAKIWAMADTTIDFMIRDPANADAHCLTAFAAVWRMLT